MEHISLEELLDKWNKEWSYFIKKERIKWLCSVSPEVVWFFNESKVIGGKSGPFYAGVELQVGEDKYTAGSFFFSSGYPYSLPAFQLQKEGEKETKTAKDFFNLTDEQSDYLLKAIHRFPFTDLAREFEDYYFQKDLEVFEKFILGKEIESVFRIGRIAYAKIDGESVNINHLFKKFKDEQI